MSTDEVRQIILAAALLAASPALAGSVVGVASVIDGDTIETHSERIRINGIDAPESRQLYSDEAGKAYRRGLVAAFALDDFPEGSAPDDLPRGRPGRLRPDDRPVHCRRQHQT